MVREPLSTAELERGERLGAILRQARGQASLSQVALAAGVSVETLRKIKTGRIPTDLEESLRSQLGHQAPRLRLLSPGSPRRSASSRTQTPGVPLSKQDPPETGVLRPSRVSEGPQP